MTIRFPLIFTISFSPNSADLSLVSKVFNVHPVPPEALIPYVNLIGELLQPSLSLKAFITRFLSQEVQDMITFLRGQLTIPSEIHICL